MPLRLRPPSPDDIQQLATLAATTFRETYRGSVPDGPLEEHIDARFSAAAIEAEIADPACNLRLAEEGGTLLGYVLLRRDATPPPAVDAERPMLLDRLYVRASAHGRGVGRALLAAAADIAVALGHDALWLTVWEANPGASAFYRRQGFEDVGTVPFQLGGEPQTDRVMVLALGDG